MGSFAGGNMFGAKLGAVGDLGATLKTVGAKLGDTVQVRGVGAPTGLLWARAPCTRTARARHGAHPLAVLVRSTGAGGRAASRGHRGGHEREVPGAAAAKRVEEARSHARA